MQLNGAEIVIECLKEQGVDTVFGYPGGAILNVYDELYKHRDEIRQSLPPMNKGLLMRLTDMREQREKSASALLRADRGRRILLPELQRHIWIQFLLWQSPAM